MNSNQTDRDPADRGAFAALGREVHLRLKTLNSRELFGGDTEIGIDHDGALYRLKITRQGKLILNK